MFWTNRHKVNVVAEHRRIGDGHGLLDARGRPAASLATLRSPATSPEEGGLAEEAALKSNEGYSSEGGSGLEGEGGDGSASTVRVRVRVRARLRVRVRVRLGLDGGRARRHP